MEFQPLVERVRSQINKLQIESSAAATFDEATVLRMQLQGLQVWLCSCVHVDPIERINTACDILFESRPLVVDVRVDLPTTEGCYFFLSESDVLYIGTGTNIRNRVANRFSRAHKVAYIEVEDEVRFRVEASLIELLKPVCNSVINIGVFRQ